MRILIQLIGAILLAGCATHLKPGKIAVMEFQANENVTAVSGFDGSIGDVGTALTNRLADELHDKDRDAVAVLVGDEPQADVVVTGRITRIDGGSRAKRLLASQTIGFGFTDYGIGGGYCAAGGTVNRAGQQIGVFSVEHQEKGTGWFWIRYGDSASHQIEECVDDMASDIADIIDEQRYTRAPNPPAAVMGTAATQPVQLTPSERLRELEDL